MIKVYQTRFGGEDAPMEKQGNCFQACVATVLQMPLEEAFDCTSLQSEDHWFDDFNEWLEQYGLGCIWFETSEEKPMSASIIRGIHIAECKSKTLYNGERHAIVIRNGELFHDPNPNAKEQGEFQGVYVFVPLEAYKLVRI